MSRSWVQTTSQLAKDLFELESLDGSRMQKLHAEFCTACPPDDCPVDPEYGGGIADFHSKEQEFTGGERFGALDSATVDGQVKNCPSCCSGHPGQRSRKLYGNSRLLTSVILKIVRRNVPLMTNVWL